MMTTVRSVDMDPTPPIDDGASPADDSWIEEGHGPGDELTAEQLAEAPAWAESRRLVAELDPAGQREANEQTYAAILGLEGPAS